MPEAHVLSLSVHARYLAILPLLLLPAARPAAAEEPPQTYEHFAVVRHDGLRIEGQDGTLSGNQLTGRLSGGYRITIPRDDIKFLYTADGSEAGLMALGGAGFGFALSLSTILILGTNSRYPLGGYANVYLAGAGAFTLGGALIGALIGASRPHWRVEPVIKPGSEYSLRLSLRF